LDFQMRYDTVGCAQIEPKTYQIILKVCPNLNKKIARYTDTHEP
jgi:hypothetical protein